MFDAIVKRISHEYFGDVTVLIEVPIDALKLTADRSERNRLLTVADEALDTPEVKLCSTHSDSSHLHAVEEGCLELGQVTHEVCFIIVALNLRDLKAIIFSSAVLS